MNQPIRSAAVTTVVWLWVWLYLSPEHEWLLYHYCTVVCNGRVVWNSSRNAGLCVCVRGVLKNEVVAGLVAGTDPVTLLDCYL